MTVYVVTHNYEGCCDGCGDNLVETKVYAIFSDESVAKACAKNLWGGWVKPMEVRDSLAANGI